MSEESQSSFGQSFHVHVIDAGEYNGSGLRGQWADPHNTFAHQLHSLNGIGYVRS